MSDPDAAGPVGPETERERIAAALAECSDMSEVIGVAIGMASMCWEHVERAGVFQSTYAADLSEALLEDVQMRWSVDDETRRLRADRDRYRDVVRAAEESVPAAGRQHHPNSEQAAIERLRTERDMAEGYLQAAMADRDIARREAREARADRDRLAAGLLARRAERSDHRCDTGSALDAILPGHDVRAEFDDDEPAAVPSSD